MPIFRFSKAFGVPSKAKAFLNLEGGVTRGEVPDLGAQRQRIKAKNRKIEAKNRRISQLREALRATKELAKMAEKGKREVSQPEELPQGADKMAVRRERRERRFRTFQAKPGSGSLPDFVIIGAQKCGTTSLYDLLSRHPLVERGAVKEIHYFDKNFDRGIEWYRSLFPSPRREDGRRTITGEATPGYLFHPLGAERMAEAVPDARLIVLLRNPVDRAYSAYHHAARYGRETRTFEEAVEAEQASLREKENETPEGASRIGSEARDSAYLARGIYVDQLLRWSTFFKDEQLLVLKSEDFFARTPQTLEVTLGFLGLPSWEPEGWKVRNEGSYEGMSPATRGELEAFFEPHNQRLYEHLGVDFGW